jgi:hypothetical protein
LNINDSGPGSLRATVAAAAPGSTINFAASLKGKTITLTTGEIAINKAVTIQGLGSASLTISGNGASRIFNVNDNTAALINVNISGLKFTGGTNAGLGGAITNNERLTLNADLFSGNSGANGGAVANIAGATLTVLNTTMTNNTTTSVGGGAMINFGTLSVQNSTLFNNHAPVNGGAINNQPGGTTTLINTTIANNTSGGLGGGLSSLGKLFIYNSTISGNTGTGGGGIAVANNNTTIQSSILAKNIGGATPDFSGGGAKVNFSLIGNTSGLTFQAGSGNNFLNVNPLLGPLQNNGGPTLTMAPLPGSLALHHGSNPKGLTTDQRGLPRGFAGNIDIGAVQVSATRRMGGII